MADTIEIFVSYSHKDEKLREELGSHLKFLQRQGLSILWYDHMIGAGNDWAHEILKHLKTSHIILLLISADFMASDYCNCVEVTQAMERYAAGEVRVIPVILRPALWESAPFGKLNALPPYGKPIISSNKYAKDRAFREVADGIQKVVEKLIAQPLATRPTSLGILDSNSLRDALLTLDYLEQVRIFRLFIGSGYRVGAFLIHGELEHGQRWLLNRLVMQVPGSAVGKPPFKFVFQRQVGSRSLEALWRALGKWVNPMKPPDSPQKIVEQVHGLWQSQTITLILNGLDLIDEQYTNGFIKDFWEQLMDIVQSKPCKSQNYYLIMFLVDNDGYVDKWQLPFTEQLDLAWKPHIPIKLRKITRLTDETLAHWIDHEVDKLPPTIAVSNILAGTEGIPQIVLEHICTACGHDWYERENAWMKY